MRRCVDMGGSFYLFTCHRELDELMGCQVLLFAMSEETARWREKASQY